MFHKKNIHTLTLPALLAIFLSLLTPPPLPADPLEVARLALALGFDEDAIRRIDDLPSSLTPSDSDKRSLLKAAALRKKGQYFQALTTIQEALDSQDKPSASTPLLLYEKALLLCIRDDFSSAEKVLAQALDLFPDDHPLRHDALAAYTIMPQADGTTRSPSEMQSLYSSMQPGRARDVLGLALLAAAERKNDSSINQIAQQLTAHPDPAISTTAQFLMLPAVVQQKDFEAQAERLEKILANTNTPDFIRGKASLALAEIRLAERQPEAAKSLAESSLATAKNVSEISSALSIWWQTLDQTQGNQITLTRQLLDKITKVKPPEARANLANAIAEKFLSTDQVALAVEFLLEALTYEPDIQKREMLLDRAAQLALANNSEIALTEWLDNPSHQQFLPTKSHFWKGIIALRANKKNLAQEEFNLLLNDADTQAQALGRLGHAALTITEDPSSPHDSELIALFPADQQPNIENWLQMLRLISAATQGDETTTLKNLAAIFARQDSTTPRTALSAAAAAEKHGHWKLARLILDQFPQNTRNQEWAFQSLRINILDGEIPYTEEAEAWRTLIPQLTQPALIAQAREHLAAAYWNVGNYTGAMSEWSKLLENADFSEPHRAEYAYFYALAARRIGETTRAEELLKAITDQPTLENTPLHCDALFELARIKLELSENPQQQIELFERILNLPTCTAQTHAMAAITIADQLLHEVEDNNSPQLKKITELLDPLSTNSQIPADLALRARVIQGLALLRSQQLEAAESAFLDVVYGRIAAGAADSARPAEMYWFARAVLEAGNLMEKREAWSQAVALYRLAETTIPPEAESWRIRRQRIEREHIIFN